MTSSEGSESDVDERHGSMSKEMLTQIQKLSTDVENIWREVRQNAASFNTLVSVGRRQTHVN